MDAAGRARGRHMRVVFPAGGGEHNIQQIYGSKDTGYSVPRGAGDTISRVFRHSGGEVEQVERIRDARYDNIKALLMFSVAAAHFAEPVSSGSKIYYFLIMIHCYTIPLYVFLSGRFASFSLQRILRRLVWPYVVFQLLYLLLSNCVLGVEQAYQFHTPYWLLWYLLAMIEWTLTVPLLQRLHGRGRWIFLAGTVLAALAAPYSSHVYYKWSLGRFFYYYPFFCLGYFCRDRDWHFSGKWKAALLAGTAALLLVLYCGNLPLHVEWWYGAMPYENAAANYTPLHRVVTYAIALVMGGCILAWMPARRTFVSTIGQNATSIYVWHGMIVKLAVACGVYAYFGSRTVTRLLAVLAAAVLVTLLLGSPPAARLTRPFICCPFRRRKPEENEKSA